MLRLRLREKCQKIYHKGIAHDKYSHIKFEICPCSLVVKRCTCMYVSLWYYVCRDHSFDPGRGANFFKSLFVIP